MVTLNKGEWSEIYAFLKLLYDFQIPIYNSSGKVMEVYLVKEIYKTTTKKQKLDFDKQNKNIERLITETYKKIKEEKSTFEIPDVEKFANDFNFGLKSNSDSKLDLELFLLNNIGYGKRLGYSIKSQIGSPSTLLNASSHTDFKFFVDGLDDDKIIKINSIDTRTKLKDRYQKLIEFGAKIYFDKIKSPIFRENMRVIDSDLDKILAKILLLSYECDEKNLKILLEKLTECNFLESLNPKIFYKDKLSRFLESVTLGMVPGTLCDFNFLFSMGGIIIVLENGELNLLDKIYYQQDLREYLIDNLKLESPSSSRYNMLEILKDENNRAFFNLNLQVRFKL
ncbi:MAG: HpaII family restriction endonuclease [Fusobacteriaceae bacterium]